MMYTKRLITCLAVLALAGCAAQRVNYPPPSPPPKPQPRGQPQSAPATQSPGQSTAQSPQQPRGKAPPRTAQEVSSPAVLSLLGRAETLARGGHLDMAAATLERALDLEPRNPFVYQRLAGVRLAQGQPGQAEVMARKSNSVAGDNPFVRSSNWRLIAEARRSTGDDSGAHQAIQRAQNYHSTAVKYRQ